ncbi:glutamine-hydrolyzing GMP synthase [Candidatus Thorarchaeota archaeon]|nr:MAG: glutamine-hydrolyzing GMP synthase [Candidatus Thorarchaeota archaeon]
MNQERILIVDYGGQYTHLISRRCRELGVYAEIVPQNAVFKESLLGGVRGVILSGGPRTVSESDLSEPFDTNQETLREQGIGVLGICFGHQLLAKKLGANIDEGENPEYGQTEITLSGNPSILHGLEKAQHVWMSHSDQVSNPPDTMQVLATSNEGHVAAFASSDSRVFGVQFHPEVAHTPNGMTVLDAFLRDVCGYQHKWMPEDQIQEITKQLTEEIGKEKVIMGTSGGVDSTVAAVLLQHAIGNRLFCVFVDNGLLRFGEREEVESAFQSMGFENFITVDAADEFLKNLDGIIDPEEKRRIIADTFIEVFERTAEQLREEYGDFAFLGQGTIYPDRVESAATGSATAVIKSHHNVKLPDWIRLSVVEPLKHFYKDEVRAVGEELGIPSEMISRQPFPGPSLAIRIGGPVTKNQLTILRQADRILQEEVRRDSIYPRIWQSFCVLIPIRSVGVMGDERTYDQAVVLRIVESRDAMTASVSRPNWDNLLRIASRIANEVEGVNRVVYDITSKPPGTIEWY